MAIAVPFDDTELSRAALDRASELADALETELVTISIIPNENTDYARERGWIDQQQSFDAEAIVSYLSAQIESIAPDAEFEYEVVGRYAQAGAIASRIRDYAKNANASLVVIGSGNAGQIVSSVSSVGRTVATDDAYDVLIVRHTHERTTGNLYA